MHKTALTPFDWLMPEAYIQIFVVFSVEERNFASALECLQRGIEKVCHTIPYLKGHVYKDADNNDLLTIQWSEEDSPLQLLCGKETDAPEFSKMKSSGMPAQHFQFLMCPIPGMPDHTTQSKAAVLRAKYIAVPGGLILGLSVHHNVLDGTGLDALLAVFAAGCSGSDEHRRLDPLEPLRRNEYLGFQAPSDKSQDQLLALHPELQLRSLAKAIAPVSGISKIWKLSIEKLSSIRSEISKNESLDAKVLSINNILCALLWSFIIRIRDERSGLTSEQSRIGYATNGRKHLQNAPKDFYVGNVNIYALAELPVSTLVAATSQCVFGSKDVDYGLLGAVVQAFSNSALSMTTKHLAEVHDLARMANSQGDNVDLSAKFGDPHDLVLTSWANMDVYDLEFGTLGSPEAVRIPYVPIDGMIVVLPRRRSSGDDRVIEVVLMLREDDMLALDNDKAWKSWIL